MVGADGFEPPASWSQTRRTTRLCYTPMKWIEAALPLDEPPGLTPSSEGIEPSFASKWRPHGGSNSGKPLDRRSYYHCTMRTN